MSNRVRVRGVKRKQVDTDKLALAFLMLVRVLHEQHSNNKPGDDDSKRETA